MLFSSMTFIWIFLPILLILYFLSKEKYRNYILLLFSLIFYSWGEPKYIILMVLSIIINYIVGLSIDKLKNKAKKKTILTIGIIVDLGLLGYFKYFNFFIYNINKILPNNVFLIKNIALPIGISFYTFQIISYIIDLYKEKIKVQKNIFKLALYISFFPQLIAGPIVRYCDINEQLDDRIVTKEKFAHGIKRFVYGLSKKVIISNTLAIVADSTFDVLASELSTSIAWLGAICYMLQIYYDFSGYSDMAIGLGKMFGFEFIENFNYPYISKSITEFWRRWHISLSTWFKEYVYIPLGGNRKGTFRTYINLSIVFLITGIWHGAAWNFIIWGIYNGFFILVERIGFKKYLDRHKILGNLYTLFIVLIGWVIFRANGLKNGIKYIIQMFTINPNCRIELVNILNIKFAIVIIIAILFSGCVQAFWDKHKQNKIINNLTNIVEPFCIGLLFASCIMMLVSNTYNPFIYFRF